MRLLEVASGATSDSSLRYLGAAVALVSPLTACGHAEIVEFMACASRFPWSLRTLGAVPTAMDGTRTELIIDHSIVKMPDISR